MSGRTHKLKTHPEQFWGVVARLKLYEWRMNDRGFMVGDKLLLELWDPGVMGPIPGLPAHSLAVGGYRICGGCGNPMSALVDVIDILHGGRFGIPEGFCIMSIDVELVHGSRNALGDDDRGLAN